MWRPFVRASGFAFASTFSASALALLIAQGRIHPKFFSGPSLAHLADVCLYWSAPGVIVEFAIRGFYSSETLFSDLLIITVNATLYAIPLLPFLRWIEGQNARFLPRM